MPGLLFGDVLLGGYQPHLGGWFETDDYGTSQQYITEDGEEIQTKIKNMMNTAAVIQKRKLFFERPENSFENFFDLLKDSKKSGMCHMKSIKQFFWVVFIMLLNTD